MKEKYITRIKLEQAKSLEDLTDWQRIEKMSEFEIEQNALSDVDNQPIIRDDKNLEQKFRKK